MTTAIDIRAVSRRLERRVAAHGCGLASCSMCQADIEEALVAAKVRPARVESPDERRARIAAALEEMQAGI